MPCPFSHKPQTCPSQLKRILIWGLLTTQHHNHARAWTGTHLIQMGRHDIISTCHLQRHLRCVPTIKTLIFGTIVGPHQHAQDQQPLQLTLAAPTCQGLSQSVHMGFLSHQQLCGEGMEGGLSMGKYCVETCEGIDHGTATKKQLSACPITLLSCLLGSSSGSSGSQGSCHGTSAYRAFAPFGQFLPKPHHHVLARGCLRGL